MKCDAVQVRVDGPVDRGVVLEVVRAHHDPLHGGVGPVQVPPLPVVRYGLDAPAHPVQVLPRLVGQQVQSADEAVPV